MTFITLPNEETRRLVFYLAMEEYLANHCEEDVFFSLAGRAYGHLRAESSYGSRGKY